MRVIAILAKPNESGRAGLSAALKNTAAGQERRGFTAGSAQFQQPAETSRGEKHLSSGQILAILGSRRMPFGECRLNCLKSANGRLAISI